MLWYFNTALTANIFHRLFGTWLIKYNEEYILSLIVLNFHQYHHTCEFRLMAMSAMPQSSKGEIRNYILIYLGRHTCVFPPMLSKCNNWLCVIRMHLCIDFPHQVVLLRLDEEFYSTVDFQNYEYDALIHYNCV